MQRCVRVSVQVSDGAHHVPDPQDDGSSADMATQTAAGGVPAVPGGEHRSVRFTAARLALKDTLSSPPTVPTASTELRALFHPSQTPNVQHGPGLPSVQSARCLSPSVDKWSGVGRWQVFSNFLFQIKSPKTFVVDVLRSFHCLNKI